MIVIISLTIGSLESVFDGKCITYCCDLSSWVCSFCAFIVALVILMLFACIPVLLAIAFGSLQAMDRMTSSTSTFSLISFSPSSYCVDVSGGGAGVFSITSGFGLSLRRRQLDINLSRGPQLSLTDVMCNF